MQTAVEVLNNSTQQQSVDRAAKTDRDVETAL